MNDNTYFFSSTKAIAERILARTFGEPVHLGEGSDLGGSNRSLVMRFPVLDGPVSAPESAIVKRAANPEFDPDTSNEPAWLLLNDWASLQFLEEIAASERLSCFLRRRSIHRTLCDGEYGRGHSIRPSPAGQ